MSDVAETPFSDMGISPVQGTEIAELIGLQPHDLNIASRYKQVRDIAKFFNGAPDTRAIITRVTMGHDDKLNQLYGYVQVRKEYSAMQNEIANLENEFKKLSDLKDRPGVNATEVRSSIKKDLLEKEKQLKKLRDELHIYER